MLLTVVLIVDHIIFLIVWYYQERQSLKTKVLVFLERLLFRGPSYTQISVVHRYEIPYEASRVIAVRPQ